MSDGSGRTDDWRRRSTFLTDDVTFSNNPSRGDVHLNTSRTNFPSFSFGAPTDASTSARESGDLTDTSHMVLDDIFGEISPPTSYHIDDFDFLNFLQTGGSNNDLPATQPGQSSFQNNPFPNSGNTFAPMMVDSHPAIVIPVSVSPDIAVQQLPPPGRSHPHVQIAQSTHLNLPLSEEAIESIPAPLLRQPQVPSMTKKPLELEPWTFDPPLSLSSSRTSDFFQGSTGPDSSQPINKTTNIPIARRKNSDTPATDSPNSLGKAPKTSHNMIEKRYRLKLNDKILSLRNAVPALRNDMHEDPATLDSIRALKLNKGTVLTKATEYIKQLEQEKEALEAEVANLKQQLAIARGRDFEWGGVAAMSEEQVYPGMISPESCTSEMSPEAKGTLFEEVVEKVRSRKRVKVECV